MRKQKKFVLVSLGVGAFFSVVLFFVFITPAFAVTHTDFGINLGTASPLEVAVQLINWFLAILALLTVCIILYGGFLWLFSRGDEQKIEKAKRVLKNAAIGLLIILAAWGITLYLLRVLGEATDGGGSTDITDDCINCGYPGGSTFDVRSTAPKGEETGVMLCTDVTVRMTDKVNQDSVGDGTFFMSIYDSNLGLPLGEGGADCATGGNKQCFSGDCQNDVCEGNHVPGVYGFGPGEETDYFNFIPEKDFEMNVEYEVVVVGGSNGVRSIDDVTMDGNYSWHFFTGEETDDIPPVVNEFTSSPFPADDEVNVCLNTQIYFDFSERMRISSFNDDVAMVLTPAPSNVPNWLQPLGLKNWNFGDLYDEVGVRPQEQLQSNSLYGVRLYAGDATQNFSGAIMDSCGNPLDGDYDTTMEGADTDNYINPADADVPLTWTTGENAKCTPIITSVTPNEDYYGLNSQETLGGSCISNANCDIGWYCVNSVCTLYPTGTTTLTIEGLYLAPMTEVEFQGSSVWAANGLNTCFGSYTMGNVGGNTGVGDYCLDDPLQEIAKVVLRTPVGSNDSNIRIRVTGETSEPAVDQVKILSPYIKYIDPDNGSIGQYVTIAGKNYGSYVSGQSKVIMRSSDGARYSELALPTSCDNTWSDTQIIAIIPEKYTENGVTASWQEDDVGYIQVLNANGYYSDPQKFNYNDIVRPNLCEIDPNCKNSGGQEFTAKGERFGNSQGSNDRVTFIVTDIDWYDAIIDSWSDKTIVGTTSTAMGQNKYIVRVIDGDPEPDLGSNSVSYSIPCDDAPKVVDISTCDKAQGVFPVPNPRPNSDNACLNAHIGVLFDRKMDTSTFTTTNVFLEQYNTGGSFDVLATPTPVTGAFDGTDWTVDYAGNYYYGFQYDIQPNGQATGLLTGNTWYQLTIKNGVMSSEGVNMASDYLLRFRTEDSNVPCEIDTVWVQPSEKRVNSHPSKGEYTGSTTSQCRLVDSNSYEWEWSLTEPVGREVANFGAIGPGIINSQTVYTSGNDEENEGTALVNAKAQEITDDAKFTMDLSFCTSDADCADCTGSICDLTKNRCTPVINNINPTDGDYGTWVTISGCMFGPRKGNVYWNSLDESIHEPTAWPDDSRCGDTWTASEIIVEVPETYDDDNDASTPEIALPKVPDDDFNYNLEVETDYGHTTESSQQFNVNDAAHPGLCKLDPKRGPETTAVTAIGDSLGDQEGFAFFYSNKNAAIKSWDPLQIETVVPSGATTGPFKVVDLDDRSSNSLNFEVSCLSDEDCEGGVCTEAGICEEEENTCVDDTDCADDGCESGSVCEEGICTPVIENIDPETGPVGGPVTINGCYFGDAPVDISSYNSGLVALWRFDEGSGNIFGDVVGVSDGTITSVGNDAVWDEGRFGSALSFDSTGTGSATVAVNAGDPLDIDGSSGISIEAWVKFNAVPSNHEYFVTRENGYTLRIDYYGGQPYFRFADSINSGISWTNWLDWKTGVWYHLTGVYDPSTATISLYINGERVTSGTPSVSWAATSNNNAVHIGKWNNYPFSGFIDSIAIYNRTLSDEEVRDHASSMILFGEYNANLLCTNGWRNNRIIAEAPESLTIGSLFPVKVINEYGSASNIDKQFTASDMCVNSEPIPSTDQVPILCDIDPEKGRATSQSGSEQGTMVTFYGDQDSYADGQTKDVFYGEDESGNPTYLPANPFVFIDPNETEGRVPYGATFYPGHDDASLARVQVEKCMGNAIDFQFECTNADDCPEGICVDGVCVNDPCAVDCSTNPEIICGTKKGCYYNATESDWCCEERPKFLSSSVTEGQTDVCPNSYFSFEFSEEMTRIAPNEGNIELKDISGGTMESWTISGPNTTTNGVQYYLYPALLETGKDYRLTIKSEKSNETGVVSVSKSLALKDGTEEINFKTRDQLCQPDHVEVVNDENGTSDFTFTSAGQTSTFTATMYADNSQPLQPVDGLSWEWTWEPYESEEDCQNVVWVDLESDSAVDYNANSSTQLFISGDEHGATATISATATGDTVNWSGSLTGTAAVDVYYCSSEADIWKYSDRDETMDSYRQYFRMIYCADDLPRLSSRVLTRQDANVNTDNGEYRQYLFTNPDDLLNQAFGVQVYSNTENLSPQLWYEKIFGSEEEVPKELEGGIDGYEALISSSENGVTYYVAGSAVTEHDTNGNSLKDLLNNIYVISFINSDTTLAIGDEVMQNILFNTNDRFRSDYRCEFSKRAKLHRDTIRLNDLGSINKFADDYYAENNNYPNPKSTTYGSYIENITNSVWDSWQAALGNLFEITLPTDPYNFFYASDADDPWNASETPWIYKGTGVVQDCRNEPEAGLYFDESGSCWSDTPPYFYCPNYSYTYLWKRNDTNQAALFGRMEYNESEVESYVTDTSLYNPCNSTGDLCECYNYKLPLEQEEIIMGL